MPALTDPPINAGPLVGQGGYATPSLAQWLTQLKSWVAPSKGDARAFYIPNTSGAPTFTPETRTGFSPLCFDPATGILYVHDGTNWLSETLT